MGCYQPAPTDYSALRLFIQESCKQNKELKQGKKDRKKNNQVGI